MSFKNPNAPLSLLNCTHAPYGCTISPTSATFASFPLPNNVLLVTEVTDLGQYDVIIDIRPYNNYSTSHLRGAVNMCIPTTLLKRSSLDLLHLLNLVNIPQSIKDVLIAQVECESPQKKLNVLVYDTNSTESHISLNLYQTISKFEKHSEAFLIHYLDGGFNLVEKHGQTSPQRTSVASPATSLSPNDIVEYSPISMAEETSPASSTSSVSPSKPHFLSGFKLPSQTNYKTKFVNSIKKNALFDDQDTDKPKLGGLAYSYKFRLPKNLSFETIGGLRTLPLWLGFMEASTNDAVVRNLVAKFTKIENVEKLRLSCLATNKDGKKHYLHLHSPSTMSSASVCSPIGQCPDCDNINYKIPRGVEYGFKNRYNNIWPYEHSRVKILDRGEDDYINANFIAPVMKSDFVYIATQNPLRDTIDDFWQIINGEQIKVIISLDNSPLLYLNNVTDIETILVSELTVVRKINKSIYHFEFKLWPDFGVPQDFHAIMSLIQFKNSLFHNGVISSENNKILVHCSAGCGRTGVFIAIDNLINAFTKDRTLFMAERDDLVYKMIHNERKQRILMVQNLDQYIVCYEMLLFYLANTEKYSSETPVVLTNLMVESAQKDKVASVVMSAAGTNTIEAQPSNSFGDDYFLGLVNAHNNAVKSN